MITSFACRDAEALFAGRRIARFALIERVAMPKLQQIRAAATLSFLRAPPGNRLERLSGDRAGWYSMRINAQWRVCFYFENGDAAGVQIIDHH